MSLDERDGFLTFSGLFLFGLLSLTLILAHWLEVPLTSRVHWSLRDLLIGVGVAGAMFACFSWLTSLREQAGEAIGRSLAACTWYDLAIMAILVGIVEEFLFRGLLEQLLARWDFWGAVIISNLLFGFLHALSPLYVVLAASMGVLFSYLTWGVGEFNLLRPIVAHAVYDFIGFMVIANDYRSELHSPSDESKEPTGDAAVLSETITDSDDDAPPQAGSRHDHARTGDQQNDEQ